MYKIGLITFHESDNYGTCLQAYALQTEIDRLGYAPSIIDYKRGLINAKQRSRMIKRLKYVLNEYGIYNILMRKKVDEYIKYRKNVFAEFRNVFFYYTNDEYLKYDELLDINVEYKAFVCGSDMIWTPERAENLDVYFLQFVEKNKRIAYAPSFGTAMLPEYLTQKYRDWLSGIKYLSCREKSGVGEIKRLTGIDAKWTLDPTLIIDKEEWKRLASQAQHIELPEKYILVYLFEGIPSWALNAINKESKKRQADIVEIPMNTRQICGAIRNGDMPIGPLEFLKMFMNADCIYTNAYHGLIFSLIFEKEFFILSRDTQGQWAQYQNRLSDILEEINCMDRLISPRAENKFKEIEYTKVNEIMNVHISESIAYLKKALFDACNCECISEREI